jgi:hypothetical protein
MFAFGEFDAYSLGEGEWQLSGHADIRKNMAIRAELAHSRQSTLRQSAFRGPSVIKRG